MQPDIETIALAHGAHASRQEGVCAMELVAWMAGEPHSDHPECTCPVLGAFVRRWNDCLGDDDRNRLLKPVLPRLIGTRSTPEIEERRAWLATDWLIRVCAPAFLELTPALRSHARTLSGLPPVLSRASAEAAQQEQAAARDAAWAAAWAAARAAAWAAARAAAGDALQPTVERLQQSALELLDRMIAEGGDA